MRQACAEHAPCTRCARTVQAAKAHVARNVSYLVHFMRYHVPGVVPLVPEATYLIWLDCRGLLARAGLKPEELHGWLLRHARLCLSPGDEFAPEVAHCVRINVACPRRMLRTALEQLRDAVAAAATVGCTTRSEPPLGQPN